MQLEGSLVVFNRSYLRNLLQDKVDVYVFLRVFVIEIDVFAANFSDCYLLHIVKAFKDLSYLFRALYHDYSPFCADRRH